MSRHTDKITIGIVGLGIGRRFLKPFLDQSERVRVVVCDLNSASIDKTRIQFAGIAAGYTDVDEMLAKERPVAVGVMVPDHLHRALTEKGLAAGCHVMVTKPMATNVEDARAMVLASRKSGKKVMVAQETRLRPRNAQLRGLVSGGKLGDIIHIQSDFICNKNAHFAASPWYGSVEAGRTAMVGSAIHNVDLVRHLVGRPITSVFAFGNDKGKLKFSGNKTVSAIYQFEGGAIATVAVSYVATEGTDGSASFFRLLGTKGTVIGDKVVYEGGVEKESLSSHEASLESGCGRCSELFLEAVLEDRPVAVEPEDAFDSVAACAAADESCSTGKVVVPQKL
jgi:predicted dehydrogenase